MGMTRAMGAASVPAGRPRATKRHVSDGWIAAVLLGVAMCTSVFRATTLTDAERDVFETINHMLVMADRERVGREASPTAAILDSQSVRTADQKGDQGAMMRARRSKGASATS